MTMSRDTTLADRILAALADDGGVSTRSRLLFSDRLSTDAWSSIVSALHRLALDGKVVVVSNGHGEPRYRLTDR